MKNFFYFVLCLLLIICPLAAQADHVEPIPQEEIIEAPWPDPMSNEVIRYLQVEEM